ncbi:methionine adenosyltransferase [Malaciobacter molluscorum]|uniref:methionine adenosyltransferase n=1 Tax=Malaciobacter molluscorum TaxID=1032072 RepID=UPI00100A59D3|nr:methionine adenosyltransferase [Malaciobacter molluscorum]RXJ95127.1 methionine adenosyltransferase [Malaciobacter molluscorum]
MTNNYLFTSESVTEGHPDKIADQISDAVLDYIIQKDKNARVACETVLTNGLCLVAGELKTEVYAPIQDIVRDVIREIGYTNSAYGLDYRSAGVLNAIAEQSIDISSAVDKENGEIGAGDQGMMFGYACDETKELMPLPINLAHKLTKRLSDVRKKGILPYLRPDGKAQVTVEYIDNKPTKVKTVVISAQHSDTIKLDILKEDIIEEVINEVIPKELINEDTIYHINPTGRFVIGGPQADAGLTGRKIIVDSYGGSCPHGGGAFSGKDPTKVDRSAAYMARYIAKNLVAAKLCNKIVIQLSYAIGISEPTSIMIDTFKTNTIEEKKILSIIEEVFDLTPSGIIKQLDLLRPIYKQTASYGHFGREDIDLPWEKLDKVNTIKSLI